MRIDADDDLGRERLFRYGLRPPFALLRLRRLADAYLIDARAVGEALTKIGKTKYST